MVKDHEQEPSNSEAEKSKEQTLASALESQPPTDDDVIKVLSPSDDSLYKNNVKAVGEDADKYDFSEARPSMKRCNISESILHHLRMCIGSGVATMPQAYRNCGLWTALVLNILIGIAVAYSMFMLTRSAQKLYGMVRVPMMLYPDIAEACMQVSPWRRLRRYSSWFRYTVDVTIAVGLFGACCVYQVAMAKTLKQLVEGSTVVLDEGKPPLKTYIILLMLPCILISMITKLKYLAPFTVVADVYIVCITIMTVYYGFTVPTVSPLNYPAFKSVSGLFEFVGICIFSMNGIGASMAVENHMEQPRKFPIVLLGAMGILITSVTLIGFFGHWGYGNEVQSLITLNYPYRPFPILMKVFMSLMLYVSYALNFWVPFELVWHYLKRRHAPAQYWFWERIYRATFVIIMTMIAYLLHSVYYLTALIGTLCMSNLCFIYPVFIELSIYWKDPGLGRYDWRLHKFIFTILTAMVVCAAGTYYSAKGLIQELLLKNANI